MTSQQPAAEWVDIDTLAPWDKNPRRNDEAAKEVAKSIQRFGFGAPILARAADRVVIAGHTRLKAAALLGLDKVPVRFLDLDPAEARALALADNKLGELAEWDAAILGDVLRELEADGAVFDGLGFSEEELRALMADPAVEPSENDDDAPAVDEHGEPDSVPGEVYELGPHRLVCGDCGDLQVVQLLMAGTLADACLTDPPYGQNQPGVTNDSPEALKSILDRCVATMPLNDGVVVAFASPRTFPAWLDSIRANGHKFERMLWFYKEAQLANPWRGWILKSEAILVSTVGVGAWTEVHPYSHDCYKVACVNSKNSGFDAGDQDWHGSVKPLAVVSDIAQRICPPAGVIYEPFGGSGTTLIAAATLGRIARLIELDPRYCDVIRRRWTRWAREHGRDPGPGALDG